MVQYKQTIIIQLNARSYNALHYITRQYNTIQYNRAHFKEDFNCQIYVKNTIINLPDMGHISSNMVRSTLVTHHI